MAKAKDKAQDVKGKAAKETVDASQVNDFLNGMEGAGTETIGAGDTSRNYLKICQPTSAELSAPNPMPGIKVGVFFSSALGKVYGPRIEVVVLRYELKWNVWQPNRGSLVRVVPVGGIPVIKDDEGHMHDHEGNDVIETQNFYVTPVDSPEDGIMIFSLTSTGLKYGRKWNSKILALKTPNGMGTCPIFGAVWQLEALYNKNKKGSWYTIGDDTTTAVEFVRYISGTEWKEHIEDDFNMIKIMAANDAQAALPAGEGQAALPAGEDTLQGV